MDKHPLPPFFAPMAQSESKFITPASLIVDAILVIGFFALMFSLFRIHVPSNDPKFITLWAALSAACISGVFWLAIQMFRVVYRAQKAAKK
jgi:RsiW-degrading membrane proteinase PrsW (M82 family)